MATSNPKDLNHSLTGMRVGKIKVEKIVSYFSLAEKNVPLRLNWLEKTDSKTIPYFCTWTNLLSVVSTLTVFLFCNAST